MLPESFVARRLLPPRLRALAHGHAGELWGLEIPTVNWIPTFRTKIEPTAEAYNLKNMTHVHAHSHDSHEDRPGYGPAPENDTGLAELLDLDAVLGAPVLELALDAASEALGTEPHTIIDLGAGTGTGSLALAARFPTARIHSLDASSAMLDRLCVAAATAGVADRVEPHLVDLDSDWPATLSGSVDLGSVDLAWAALSLHHVASPERVLQQVKQVLRPGGVLVVMEMTGATGFDPNDLGTGNQKLGNRIVDALAARGYPVTGEWTTELTEAGFTAVQRIDTAITASADSVDGAHYLELNLNRNRGMLSGDQDAETRGHEHRRAGEDRESGDSATGHSATGHSATGHSATGHSAGDDSAVGDDPEGLSVLGLSMQGLSTEDLDALDTAISELTAGTSRLRFSSGRAIWVAIRP